MLNFSLICLFSLFLISQKIYLLNEESLILLCFIVFCWAIFHNIKGSVISDFSERSFKIKDSVIESLNQVINTSNESISLQQKSGSVILDLKNLKLHFVELNSVISDNLHQYSVQQTKTAYSKKLIFVQRLEQQSNKLLTLLLLKKLNKIVLLRNFYTQKLFISNFLCLNKVTLREYFEII